tara:strand:- start:3 stop:284 length:282 start_codon:yes stop_codon:yes gene_type:complete
MPKKSYMDKSNILTEQYFKSSRKIEEGFLSALAKFVKKVPKFGGKSKKQAMGKLKGSVDKLNNELDTLEKMNRKWLPDDYPPLPRFSVSDFIK